MVDSRMSFDEKISFRNTSIKRRLHAKVRRSSKWVPTRVYHKMCTPSRAHTSSTRHAMRSKPSKRERRRKRERENKERKKEGRSKVDRVPDFFALRADRPLFAVPNSQGTPWDGFYSALCNIFPQTSMPFDSS